MGEDQDIDHCAAELSLSLTRPKTPSRDLPMDVQTDLLSLLQLEVDWPASQRIERIVRVVSQGTKEDEVLMTISPLSATQRRQSSAAWQSTVSQSVAAMMKAGPSWLIAELLRSSLADRSGEIKKADLRTLQRLQKVGPIRLQCEVRKEDSATNASPAASKAPAAGKEPFRPSPPRKEETPPPHEVLTNEDELPHPSDRTAPQPTDPVLPVHKHDAEAGRGVIPPTPHSLSPHSH